MCNSWTCLAVSGLLVGCLAISGSAQTPLDGAFTYQGRLNAQGQPASGPYNLQFRLYAADTGGTPLATYPPGGPIAVTVEDGLFTAIIDFGTATFSGERRWLEVVVDGTTLAPRQELTATPYALYALNGPGGEDFWQAGPVGGIYYDDGSVGIGAGPTPSHTLEVTGDMSISTPGGGTANLNLNDSDGGATPPGIVFRNNAEAAFYADDQSDEVFAFRAGLAAPRTHNAHLRICGPDDNQYIDLTHDGDDAVITGTSGDLVLYGTGDHPAMVVLNSLTTGDIRFYTGGALPPADARMIIDAAGNVGVGTPTPGAKLNAYTLSGTAVQGQTGSGTGVFGVSNDLAVLGQNSTSGAIGGLAYQQYGVYGEQPDGYAGYFNGDVHITGGLTLDGIFDADAWLRTGNAGTDPNVNFLGTTDNQPLVLKVNGGRALRLEEVTVDLSVPPTYDHRTGVNVLAGSPYNTIAPWAGIATVAGGGEWVVQGAEARGNAITAILGGTIGGGSGNTVEGNYGVVPGGSRNNATGHHSTVSGGFMNHASGDHSTVGGGYDNHATGGRSTIGGGYDNEATGYSSTVGGGYVNDATGDYSTVGGGLINDATGYYSTIGGGYNNNATADHSTIGGGYLNQATGDYSTIPGGRLNVAGGDYGFAAGRRAKVRDPNEVGGGDTDGDEGTFIWADSTDADFTSTGPDQFLIRATGGVGIGTTTPAADLALGDYGYANSLVAGHAKQLALVGTFNTGANFGPSVKLLISDYNNDGPDEVFPIYVEDENNVVDFYIRTQSPSSRSAYFGGNVGIGTNTPTAKLQIGGTPGTDGLKFPDGTLQTTAARGILSAAVSVDPPSLAAAAATSITVTVAGAATGDAVVANPGANLPNGYAITFARVSAANTVTIGFINGSGASQNPASSTWALRIIK